MPLKSVHFDSSIRKWQKRAVLEFLLNFLNLKSYIDIIMTNNLYYYEGAWRSDIVSNHDNM